jgi:hypothetical protein
MKNIIIVGGGSAGWMTASTLIKAFPQKNITLIESPNTPTVGVGESTIGGIRNWTNFLNVKDKDFLYKTDGSYKLSIKFTDFYKKGESFHYPFGKPFHTNNLLRKNDWYYKKIMYPDTPYSDYASSMFPQMALVDKNKITYNKEKKLPLFNFMEDTAFHFDATKFGIWLKDNFAIPKGVKHIKEEIKTIEKNEEGIVSLNKKHKADLFIDCTGFKSLLLAQEMKEPFESYEDLLPNNSAWATRIPYIEKEKELVGYTNCTAIENGWVWNIPLWSRIGSGYVYSDKFISDEDALVQFKKYLMKIEPYKLVPCDHLEFKNIKMRVGIHRRLWVKNVCAIGLAAGFIEPLESNGLFSVHEFLFALIRNLAREKVSQWDKDNFTFECKKMFRTFSEFVALHYALSHRTDTPYWKANFNKNWEEKLINLKPFSIRGFVDASLNRTDNFEFFDDNAGLHCIATGMHWQPTDINLMLYKNFNSKEELFNFWKPSVEQINKRKEEWHKKVKEELNLYKFLKKEIYFNER